MRVKIRLETRADVREFVRLAEKFVGESIRIYDDDGLAVNAKSMLGVIYSWQEWDNMTLVSDKDHFFDFRQFIIEE